MGVLGEKFAEASGLGRVLLVCLLAAKRVKRTFLFGGGASASDPNRNYLRTNVRRKQSALKVRKLRQ